MWSVDVLKWGDILSGRGLSGTTRTYHSQVGDYDRWATAFAKSATAYVLLDATESAADFFQHEPDLGILIPQNQWAEAFYTMKMGFHVPGVPMQFLYFAKKIYDKYNICNLIGPCMPKEVGYYLQRENYFGQSYTALDALRTYVNENFQPLTSDKPIVRCGSWYEVYIPRDGMVAAVPACVGEKLGRTDIEKITRHPMMGLMFNGAPLVSIGGLRGVCNSVYDLRNSL